MSTPENPKTTAIDDTKLEEVAGGFPFLMWWDVEETSPNKESDETSEQPNLTSIK